MASKKRRGAKGITTKHLWAALGVLILFLFLFFTQAGQNAAKQTGLSVFQTTSTTSAGANLCGVTKPLQLTEIDALGGSAFASPTGVFYQGTAPYAQLESPSWSASGVATTSGKYSTGTALALQLSAASQVTEFLGGANNIPFVVPPMTCGDTSTNNVFNVYGITLAAYTITVTGAGGTTFTSSGTFYFSQFPGGASGTEQVTVFITANTKNQGYKTSYDIINGLWQGMVIELKDTAANLAVTGMPRQLAFGGGSTRYWPLTCPDGLQGQGYGSANGVGTLTVAQTGTSQSIGTYDSNCQGSLSLQTIGTATYGGQGVYFTFGVAKGALGSGSTETITIQPYKYGDINWWIANGVYGPNAAKIGAPVGGSAGSAFSLILGNT